MTLTWRAILTQSNKIHSKSGEGGHGRMALVFSRSQTRD
jgi:hypothetical protein